MLFSVGAVYKQLLQDKLKHLFMAVSHQNSVMGLSLNTVYFSLLISCRHLIEINLYCKSIIQENPEIGILFETKPCGLGGGRMFSQPTQSHF